MSEDLLVVSNVVSGYGSVSVINDVSIRVRKGEIVSLVGANGAGKSTLLNTISGIIPLKSGSVSLEGEDLAGRSAATVSRKGLRHVPEGRRVFADLTVEENLWLGGYRQPKQDVARRLDYIYGRFPRLAERRWQAAGTMSGGEQQMLAIGRAITAGPKVLMLDEPSMGLAPLVVAEIFRIIRQLRDDTGVGILLVEQNARAALRIADSACVLSLGKVTLTGSGSEILKNPEVVEMFLGGNVSPLDLQI